MPTAADMQQLQFQIAHRNQELGYLRKYIVLTRLLRRTEDNLTEHVDYSREGVLIYTTRLNQLRRRLDQLVYEMIYEIQLNEVLDDLEASIIAELK